MTQLAAQVLTGNWTLDPSRSTVSLKSVSMLGLARVNGVFRQVTGQGAISPDGEVNGSLTVAAASIDTKQGKRDKHLRSADFFDSDNYPDITFTVRSVQPSGEGENVTVTGDLTVRGRTRPLSFAATVAIREDGEIWLDARVRINRGDFGLTWNFLRTMSMDNDLSVHAVFGRETPLPLGDNGLSR
jgi:polyisoprenoid-binding protein YceI